MSNRHQRKLRVKQNSDGTVSISSIGFQKRADVRGMNLEEKIDRIKQEILLESIQISTKIERMIKKELEK